MLVAILYLLENFNLKQLIVITSIAMIIVLLFWYSLTHY